MSIILAVMVALQPGQPDLTAFNLLSGDWHCYQVPPARSGPRTDEEYWVRDGRGGMIGVGRSIWTTTRSLEHMRIARDRQGHWTYYASPNGAAPVAFRLVRHSASELVFENRTHDYPQRISYRREPNHLIATISRIDGSRMISWRYTDLRSSNERRAPCRSLDGGD